MPEKIEYIRTNTLVKNSVIQIDGTPFRQWYEQHYGVQLIKKKKAKEGEEAEVQKKIGKKLQAKQKERQTGRVLDSNIEEQFHTGRLYACISSRPGQSGRADGYILEGDELKFYLKKIQKRREK